MATYPPLILDLSMFQPGRMGAPHIVGGAVESGAALSGITIASDATGGGFVAIEYSDIQVSFCGPDRIVMFSRFMVALQGGIRTCIVPFMTDYMAPVAGNPFSSAFTSVFGGSPASTPQAHRFSDGSSFDDGSAFGQAPVAGKITADGTVGSATVSLTVVGGRALHGGEWFGVQHKNKSFRAYCVVDIDQQSVDENGIVTATVAIRPTLRDAVSVDMIVDWWRPRCLMRIRSGSDPTLDLAKFWEASPSLQFVEAF